MSILILLAIIVIVAVVELAVYDRGWSKGLNVSLRFGAGKAVEGGEAELVEVVEYGGKLPLPWLTVKFQSSRDLVMPDSENARVTDYYYREDVFSINPGERITRRLPIKCEKRGVHGVRSIDVLTSDLLMVRDYVMNYTGGARIVVYPSPVDVSELEFRARRVMGDFIVRRNLTEDPFFFRGVREYVEGDSPRSVNWRASARTDRLAVNQYESTTSMSAGIWLDVGRGGYLDNPLTEEGIRIAASIATGFVESGIPVGLVSNGRDILTGREARVFSGCSPQHAENIGEALARLNTALPARSLPAVTKGLDKSETDEFIIIISAEDRPDIRTLVQSIPDTGREVLWITPVPRDEMRSDDELRVSDDQYIWRMRQ